MCEYESFISGVLVLQVQLTQKLASEICYDINNAIACLLYLLLLTFITSTNNGKYIILFWFAFACTWHFEV